MSILLNATKWIFWMMVPFVRENQDYQLHLDDVLLITLTNVHQNDSCVLSNELFLLIQRICLFY